jgi:DNA polymerase-3 subunit gamma/tau
MAAPGAADPRIASPGGAEPDAARRSLADDDAPPLTDDDAPPPFDDPGPAASPARATTPARSADTDAHPFDTAPTAGSAAHPDGSIEVEVEAQAEGETGAETRDADTADAGDNGDAAPGDATTAVPPASSPAATAVTPSPSASGASDTPDTSADEASPLEPTAPTPPVIPVGPIELAHVRDAWPEVLAQLEVASRASWLVVSTATVRAFDDEVLTLSFRTAGDLNAFKTRTADGGPSEDLRQALQTVLGVRVKYLARLEGDGPGGSGPGAPPRGPSAPEAGSAAGPRTGTSTGAPSAARSSAPYAASVTEWTVAPIPSGDGAPTASASASLAPSAGPASPSAAGATAAASTALAVDEEPDEATATPGAFAVHPGVVLPPREVAPSVPAPDEVDDDDVIPPADDVDAPLPPVVVPRMAPLSGGVQRYGEAVVRQMLGATYVRDEPYEPPTRFS